VVISGDLGSVNNCPMVAVRVFGDTARADRKSSRCGRFSTGLRVECGFSAPRRVYVQTEGRLDVCGRAYVVAGVKRGNRHPEIGPVAGIEMEELVYKR